jgi:hypothetical protein
MTRFPPIAEPPLPFFPAGLVRIIQSVGPGLVLRLTD